MALFGGSGRRRASPGAMSEEGSVNLPEPDLRFELQKLQIRFGRAALIAELERMTKPPMGRPRLNDRERLTPQFEQDAWILLAGGDPYKQTDYKIAKAHSEADPGHSRESTARRLRDYLKAHRADAVLFRVIVARPEDYPHAAYIRALRWPIPTKYTVPDALRAAAAQLASDAEAAISGYREKLGEPPAAMTLAEIRRELWAWSPPPARPDPSSALSVLWDLADRSN